MRISDWSSDVCSSDLFDGRTRNQASTRMSGIDLNIDKDFSTRFGEFSAGLNLSKLLSHEIREVPAQSPVDILDTIYNPLDLRARASLTWTKGNWSASGFVNMRSEEHTSELQSLMRISYTVFCLKTQTSSLNNIDTITSQLPTI